MPPPLIRPATDADADAVAAIYNHGISERGATLETRHRSPREVAAWIEDGRPFLVAVDAERVLGFARVSAYSLRRVYAGIGEHGIYVAADARRAGIGLLLLEELARVAEAAGYHKLTSRVLAGNSASLALHRAAGFAEVGVQRRHGKLDGEWKDTVLVERLLGEAAR